MKSFCEIQTLLALNKGYDVSACGTGAETPPSLSFWKDEK
jgi:hypothetical protein